MNLWARRKHLRTEIKLPVGLDLGGGLGQRGVVRQTKDISPRGTFVYTSELARVGTRMFCRILLPSKRKITMPGTVWRTTPDGLALKFDRECLPLLTEFTSQPSALPDSPFLIPFHDQPQGSDPVTITDVDTGLDPAHPLTDKTVLVIENDEPNSRLIEDVLQKNGYVFRVETSSNYGLIYFNENKDNIGLIVLDLLCPGLSPDKLLKLTRALRPDIPVLLITGYGYIDDHSDSEHVLERPFDDKKLLELLSASFSRSRASSMFSYISDLCRV